MTGSLGTFILWLSLFFTIYQFIISKNNKSKKYLAISSIGLLISSLISFLLLIYAYVVSDFTILNVFQNSHTTKPLIYKIAAVWGNHEGSMLLWILVLALFNYFIFKLINNKNSIFISKCLQTQAIVSFGFILMV